MGLAVQAPADPILAIATQPPEVEGAPSAPASTEGAFAALIAAILDGQPGTCEGDAGGVAPPPVPVEEPAGQTTDTEALSLAILAAVTLVQPVITVPPEEPVATGTAVSETAVPASAVSLGDADGLQIATSAAPAVEAAATESAPGAVPAPDETPSPEAHGGAAAQTPPTEATVPLDSLREALTTDGTGIELPVETTPAAPDTPAKDGAPAAQPPMEAESATTAHGMVRNVGNASQTPDGQAEAGRGRRPVERSTPRASATGIENAAANSAVGQLRQEQVGEVAPAPAADAPAPAEPPAAPPQVDQVASAVIERVEAGGGEARIHLDPVDLGEVVIHVRTDGDQVRVEVRAERPEAARLLRDHTQDLSNLLGSQGLNLADVNVGVGGGNAENPFERRDGTPRPASGDFAAILGGDGETPSAGIHNRLRAAYNPDGALLYRV